MCCDCCPLVLDATTVELNTKALPKAIPVYHLHCGMAPIEIGNDCIKIVQPHKLQMIWWNCLGSALVFRSPVKECKTF